jgi:IS30 family transposase
MKQEHDSTERPKSKHLTGSDRLTLETLCRHLFPGKKKPNFAELGRRMGKDRSTISREWHRGQTTNLNSQLEACPVYSAAKAQSAADTAALGKGPRPKLTNRIADDIRDMILNRRLSPYAALVVLAAEGRHPWLPCERGVYNAIDAGLLGVSRRDLPYRREKDAPRPPRARRMAYNNARGRPITQRPAAANERSEPGHWEMDTVVGGAGKSPACLLVLTERMSRLQVVRKMPEKTQRAVAKALDGLERQKDSPIKGIKTLTCDNGCEFLDFPALERSCLKAGAVRCEVYYAHPCCAFERGSNENANRIIRRFIPKGADIADYSRKRIRHIQDWINALPRKILDGMNAAQKLQHYQMHNAA